MKKKFPVNYIEGKIILLFCSTFSFFFFFSPYVSKGSKWCIKSLKAEIKIRCKVLLIPLRKESKTDSTPLSGYIFSKLPRCKIWNFYKGVFKVLLKVSNQIRSDSKNNHWKMSVVRLTCCQAALSQQLVQPSAWMFKIQIWRSRAFKTWLMFSVCTLYRYMYLYLYHHVQNLRS